MSKSHSRRKLFECLVAILRGDVPDDAAYLEEESYWHSLLPLADLHRIVPALPSGLRKVGVWEQVPESVSTFLDAVYELNVERSHALTEQGLGILGLLDRQGIPAIPLKGLAYELIGLHGRPGRRLTGDIDLLVAQSDAAAAQQMLVDQGYVPKANGPDDETSGHHLPGLSPPPGLATAVPVEVHLRLGLARHLHLLPPDEIMATARITRVNGQSVRVPRSVDLLQHAVVHSGLQHRYHFRRTTRLRDVLDIGRLWAVAKEDVEGISDLPVAAHGKAAAYFGACLLLSGVRPDELGPLANAAKRAHARILQRQAVPERRRLEVLIAANLEVLREHPLSVIRKFFARNYFQKILVRLRSPTV